MITIDGTWFKDDHGRSLLLRGVNLGGNTKVPFTPNGATWNKAGFYNHRQVSFVGRPFPLDQADEHFTRLCQWGLTFLRFLTTWEAVEHAGPGLYDLEYLDYLHALVKKAGDYGISMFIDPHQDVWSRFSGGDGAPGWTFEAAGMDPTRFHTAGAAILHQEYGDPLPRMAWPSNAAKLASATMFTLFFAGNDFAPLAKVDGQPIQDFLQGHYIASMQQVANRLKELPNVVGYDSLNEPSAGWISIPDLDRFPSPYKIGASPSPFQSILLGSGYPQEVGVWQIGLFGTKLTETKTFNPEKRSVWLPGRECVWKTHGVWEVDPSGEPRLLKPDYFARVNGRLVDFNRDYLLPFVNRYAAAIREVVPNTFIFVEMEPSHLPPAWGPGNAAHIVSAPHWYDSPAPYTKDFHSWLGFDFIKGRIVLGARRVRQSNNRQLERFKQAASERMGVVPTLIGEIGIPFDMQKKKAFRTGDYKTQVRAMDRSLKVMDDTLLNYTIWNYTADNSNARGDQWNDEDLSIFSRDQQKDPADINSGGRALEALVRPYARATAGEPLRMSFDIRKKVFEFEFRHDPYITAPTEFFIPNYQYPNGYRVEVSDGTVEIDQSSQKLLYHPTTRQDIHKILVKKN
jgi:hypothetical protein